jgi:hypothetical protein
MKAAAPTGNPAFMPKSTIKEYPYWKTLTREKSYKLINRLLTQG